MKRSSKLLVLMLAVLKITALGCIGLNVYPLVFTQFVIIPLLLLETIAVAGYVIEFGGKAHCHRERFENADPLTFRQDVEISSELQPERYSSKRIA